MDATPNIDTTEVLLLTVPAAARALSICPRSIYAIVARGEPPLQHVGRASRIHIDDIRKFAANLGAQPPVRKGDPTCWPRAWCQPGQRAWAATWASCCDATATPWL